MECKTWLLSTRKENIIRGVVSRHLYYQKMIYSRLQISVLQMSRYLLSNQGQISQSSYKIKLLEVENKPVN